MNEGYDTLVKGEAHLNGLLGYFKILKCMEFIAELDQVSQVKQGQHCAQICDHRLSERPKKTKHLSNVRAQESQWKQHS